MWKSASFVIAGSLAMASLAAANPPATTSEAPATGVEAGAAFGITCQHVVSAERGAKPQRLCLTKAEWEAKKLADAKDATRTVCRYEEMPGTRFKSAKICMPATEWAEQRRLEREAIETIQRNVCVPGAGC